MARPPELLYAVDEKPPAGVLVMSAIQHVMVIAITLVFPLILAREGGIQGSHILDLVSLSMLALGASTLIYACIPDMSAAAIYVRPAIPEFSWGPHCSPFSA